MYKEAPHSGQGVCGEEISWFVVHVKVKKGLVPHARLLTVLLTDFVVLRPIDRHCRFGNPKHEERTSIGRI